MSAETEGAAEQIFLVLKLVPMFSLYFFVPVVSERFKPASGVCTEVGREQPDPAEQSDRQAGVPPLQLPCWWVTLGRSPNLCSYL